MEKFVRFLRKNAIAKIALGMVFIVLLLCKKETTAIWLAHIWMFVYYWPVAYEISGSINMAFCHNPLLKSEKNSGFRKKVKLNSFGNRIFVGYGIDGNMLWLPLVYQTVLLAYALVLALLNMLFAVMFIAAKANLTLWIWIWILEILVQSGIFVIVFISGTVKDIYLWSKMKKDPNYSKESSSGLFKRDLRMLKNKKIIKRKREIYAFLKRYGLNTNKHKRFLVAWNDIKSPEDALVNKFPQLHTVVFEDQNGKSLLNVCDAKTKDVLMQIKITKS